jgi:nucleotide sugar dehydrogenase
MKILNLSRRAIKNAADRGQITLGVIGLGYVGLPTALLFAKANLKVVGIDIDASKIEKLRKGQIYISSEKGLRELLHEVQDDFFPTTRIDDLKNADVFILSVPTLIKQDKTLDLNHVKSACCDLAPCLSKEDLVIVQSTVPPGTTEGFIRKILEKKSKLRAGVDFGIATCPERANPGAILQSMRERKRIIGGLDKKSLNTASVLYSLISRHEPIKVPNIRTAEMVKVVENALRDVEIAYANMIALYCGEMKVNVGTVIDLVNTHPGRKMLRPGAGVGGACIPVNPHFIIQTSKDPYTDLLSEARKINDYMPYYVVEQVSEWIKQEGVSAQAAVLLLGYSYKANVGDIRFSPAKKIFTELRKRKFKASIYDPYAKTVVSEAQKKFFIDDLYEAATKVHCMIASVGHDIFKSLKFTDLARKMRKPLFYDCTFSFDSEKLRNAGFQYKGVGRL